MMKGTIDVKKQFGLKVRHYRMIRNISQEELGDITGLHRTYISDVERGQRNLSLENIYALAKALGVRMGSLLDFD
ncbi:helix-turn-helix domain-containing protein [Metabacillus herbersteinensis]|uniref:helix-turn-helix domain-containing protein n=1 Tax=Metabacillus herbersteinensis TaxID=283816 RepID=UPI00366DD6D5